MTAMKALSIQFDESILRKVLKRLHYPIDVRLLFVRWFVAYALNLRNLEEMMGEWGEEMNHATVHRWALKILTALSKVLRGRKWLLGLSYRMNETILKCFIINLTSI